ncbi:MAG TPA: type III-A CRISPR-associated RAMP protein Csm5 [Roseiflexaceae bacterium]|nr:type III-A CRISPR-associated RAMP protein Csm5 [Roseiflexaceae bacterium]
MRAYHLTVTTLAPLHIGSGQPPLRKGIDFVAFNRAIYVFDTARVIDYVVGDDTALLERVTQAVNLASFLKEQDFRERPDLALYRLSGAPSVSEVRPQIKDVLDRPYLPGSSLKGAIRTALVEAALLARNTPLDPRRLGDRDKYAAQELERDVAGRGERPSQAPNYDLFRTLRVADSAPGERTWLSLSNVAVWPAGERGIPLDVETVAAGHPFTTTLTIDDYLFSQHAAQLGFAPKRPLIEGLAATCREHARARITAERAFFDRRPEAALVAAFYADLERRLVACGEGSFLLQLGWGAGWRSKTVARVLERGELLASVVRRYRLDRGRGRGDVFPATRHLVVEQRRPVSPLGWVRVDIQKVTR